MKKLLMVAYFFPPVGGIGAAGSQRVLKFAKYLPTYGWKPVILTGKEAYYEPYLSFDQTLLEKVPAEATIVRTAVIRWVTRALELQKVVKTYLHSSDAATSAKAPATAEPLQSLPPGKYQRLKDMVTDLFEIPDEEVGWFLPGVYTGLRLIRKEAIEAIYSTGRPWTAHLIGVALQRLTGKPLVVDFRDPWLTNPFRNRYSALRERLETALEKLVVEKANIVIANTRELQLEFIQRFQQQPAAKFIALRNGFDPDDNATELSSEQMKHDACFTMVHTGFLYGKRDPGVFLKAVKLLVEEQRLDRKKLKVLLVGSVELPYDLLRYLTQNGLQDIVLLRDHIPYQESLDYLRKADILVLLQPGTTTQIPSKLFEYIGMQKPILTISPRNGATCRLVLEEGLGIVADSENIQEIKQAIFTLYLAWQERRLSSTINKEAHQKFDARNIAATLASTLTQLQAGQ